MVARVAAVICEALVAFRKSVPAVLKMFASRRAEGLAAGQGSAVYERVAGAEVVTVEVLVSVRPA